MLPIRFKASAVISGDTLYLKWGRGKLFLNLHFKKNSLVIWNVCVYVETVYLKSVR